MCQHLLQIRRRFRRFSRLVWHLLQLIPPGNKILGAFDWLRTINLREWLWLLLCMILLTGSGIFCGWALLWLTRIPPVPDCDSHFPLPLLP